MRDIQTTLEQLIAFAKADENIRALVLQGSFVNPNAPIDEFSDLDPLFFVRDLAPFINNTHWKFQFGDPISFYDDDGAIVGDFKWYTRLTLYRDGFKIDFGFQTIQSAHLANHMPLYQVLLDKDGIIPEPEVSDERKFYVEKPNQSAYLSTINNFFWDSSYVVKALARDEMVFAKYMTYQLHRKINRLLAWYVGSNHDFKVNVGAHLRYIKRYLSEDEWRMVLATYASSNQVEIIRALRAMYRLTRYLGQKIGDALGYKYPLKHDEDMNNYCEDVILLKKLG